MDKSFQARVMEMMSELMDGPIDSFVVYAVSDTLVHLMIAAGVPREEAIQSFEKLARSHFWVPPQQMGGFAMLVDGQTGEATNNPAPYNAPAIMTPEQFAKLAQEIFDSLPADAQAATGETPYDVTARRLFDQVFTAEQEQHDAGQ